MLVLTSFDKEKVRATFVPPYPPPLSVYRQDEKSCRSPGRHGGGSTVLFLFFPLGADR